MLVDLTELDHEEHTAESDITVNLEHVRYVQRHKNDRGHEYTILHMGDVTIAVKESPVQIQALERRSKT